MEEILTSVRVLIRTEMILFKIHLKRAANQAVLIAIGIVSILIAVAMLNVAAYVFLSEHMNPAVGGLLLALMNGLLAVALFTLAGRMGQGSEAEMTEEIRDLAYEQLEAKAESVGNDLAGIKSDVERIRDAFHTLGKGAGLGLSEIGPLLHMVTRLLKRNTGSS
ncbi:hypothetical protein ACFL2Q_14035, partial [Thermodesulfobacteriota bacterium]